jgi:hypothetical protein
MLIRKDNGRWKIKMVIVHGPEVTATVLQEVPTSLLDLHFNLGPGGRLTAETPDLGKMLVANEGASLEELAAEAARADAPKRLELPEPIDRPRLTRPDGTDPDGFAARVAAAYKEYAQQSRSPALRIADEAGVPVATARSWIREARRRGALPPGRKGKAG